MNELNLYYLFDFERMQWWRPGFHGYTNDITQAGEYDLKTALKITTNANQYEGKKHQPNTAMVPIEGYPIP